MTRIVEMAVLWHSVGKRGGHIAVPTAAQWRVRADSTSTPPSRFTVERFRLGGGRVLLNQSGVDFLFTDLDLAMTFLALAEVSASKDTVHRNYVNARKAYGTAVRLLEKLRPDAKQRQALDAKLTLLKTRLQDVRQHFKDLD
jgi:hypothetical protein